MKHWLSAVALIVMCSLPAAARSPRPQVDTPDFAVETCTSTTVNIGQTVATEVISASVALASATRIEIANTDTQKLLCGFGSNVSKTITSPAYGREVQPATTEGGRWVLYLNLDKFAGIWCLANQAYDGVRATITKCR